MTECLKGSFASVIAVVTVSFVATPAIGQTGQNMVPGNVPGYESMKPLGAKGQVIARKDIPRGADGKPDFTGVWAGPGYSHKVGLYDTDDPHDAHIDTAVLPPFKAGGEKFFFQIETGDLLHDDPTSLCLPDGMPREIFSFFPTQFIQAPSQMVVIYEYMHYPRSIPIGAANRPHSDWDGEKTWMGDAIGWWEGDTFVIDTIGLRQWWWDNSHFPTKWHSDEAHLIERITYTDSMTASYKITFDDPKVFTKTWTQDYAMKLHPTWKIMEFECEENDRCPGGKCKK